MFVTLSTVINSRFDWMSSVLTSTTEVQSPTPVEAQRSTPINNKQALPPIVESLRELRASVIDFYGGIGSLVLVVIFLPAFFKHTGEIDFAGACHSYYYETLIEKDTPSLHATPDGGQERPDDAHARHEPIYVANWDTIQRWKEKYGLTLSYANVAGSFLAIVAPLLSNSLINLAKFLPNFGK
jgi:hypothetical protein